MKLDPSAFVADPELIKALEQRSTAISCGGDRILFHQGEVPEGLYILDQGETTLTMASLAGDQVMSAQAPAGSLLGLPGLIGNEPYTLTAVARAGSRLSFVTREDFTAVMQTDPRIGIKILQVLAAEVRSARRALSNL
ncbi:MAG: cyclic nucleotide-binding domain-containing protein [Terracidiphilus sp.]